MGLGIGLSLGICDGAGFNPNNLPNLLVSLLPSVSSITIATGVSVWADQSGNGNNATQATGAKQPTYNASGGPNNLPYLGFAASSNQKMGNATAVIPSFGAATGCTVFVVHKFNAVNALRFSFSTSPSATYGICSSVDGGGAHERDIFVSSVGVDQEVTPAATTSWELWTMTCNGAGGPSAQTLRVNGSAIPISVNATISQPATGYQIGSLQGDTDTTFTLDGGVCLALVYGRLLSAPEILQVEAWILTLTGL